MLQRIHQDILLPATMRELLTTDKRKGSAQAAEPTNNVRQSASASNTRLPSLPLALLIDCPLWHATDTDAGRSSNATLTIKIGDADQLEDSDATDSIIAGERLVCDIDLPLRLIQALWPLLASATQ